MNNKFLKIGIVIALALAIGFVLSFKFHNRNNMKTSVDKSEVKVEKSPQTTKLIDNQNSMETSTDKTEVKVEKASQTPLPKLIDLGAGKCIPCKMMAPILEELKREYEGILDIVVIDVWKNPFEAQKYGIRVIPTQIFYDANGKEFFRHEGFLSKGEILRTFKDAGLL